MLSSVYYRKVNSQILKISAVNSQGIENQCAAQKRGQSFDGHSCDCRVYGCNLPLECTILCVIIMFFVELPQQLRADTSLSNDIAVALVVGSKKGVWLKRESIHLYALLLDSWANTA